MIKVHCHTNLDLYNEKWPSMLPARPVIGDLIESAIEHPQFEKDENGFSKGVKPTHFCRLRLKVVSITWKQDYQDEYCCEVELHDSWPKPRSIREFYEWYAPMVNKRVSAFI